MITILLLLHFLPVGLISSQATYSTDALGEIISRFKTAHRKYMPLPFWHLYVWKLKVKVDQNWGRMAKIRFFGQKPSFWAQKKDSPLNSNHVLVTTGKSCSKKKVAFSQINISLLRNFGWLYGLKPIFGQKTLFGIFFQGGLNGKVVAPGIHVICPIDESRDHHTKHCKNCECCPGHYLSISVY